MTKKLEHFYQTIQGWFDYEDLYEKMILRYSQDGNKHITFVELGSWKGRSAAYMGVEIANAVSSGNKDWDLFCVDHWCGISNEAENVPDPYGFFLKNIAPVSQFIKPLKMHTVDAAFHFRANSCQFVFIDADHSYSAVAADIFAWLPKVSVGGTLAGHDYTDTNFPGVKQAVDELLPEAVVFGKSCWLLEPDKVIQAKERLGIHD